MAFKKGNEIATIDVSLLTLKTKGSTGGSPPPEEYALDTASKISVSPQMETQDAVKLIIKGQLKAQKRSVTTITGNTVVITDNVFPPQIIKILQGGTITMGTGEAVNKVIKYEPPVAGSLTKGEVFELCAYSSIYDAAGLIVGYEKITYPNCEGTPISLSSEDNVFRVAEYTINSAPKTGESPYIIEYVDVLPTVS